MRSAPSPWALLLTAALAAAPALGQSALPQRIYIGSGLLLGSSRTVALSGASTALAEGADGISSNLATLAHRNARRDGQFDFDLTFSYLAAPSTVTRDLDNDGIADNADRTDELMLAGLLQFGRAGIGFSTRTSDVTHPVEDGASPGGVAWVSIRRVFGGLGAALAIDKDQIIIGLGVSVANAAFVAGGQSWQYSGANTELGVLLRPLGKRFRCGLTLRQGVSGTLLPGGHSTDTLLGRGLYAGTASPGLLSVGASVKFGKGWERYNRLSRSLIAETKKLQGIADPVFDADFDSPAGSVLLTVQLDLTAAVPNATSLRAFTHQEPPLAVGATSSLVPRAGVEWEALPKRLRARGGVFLEPSPFPGRGARPHLTGGLEVLAFHLWDDWTVSGVFDVAPLYSQFGVSVGFWR